MSTNVVRPLQLPFRLLLAVVALIVCDLSISGQSSPVGLHRDELHRPDAALDVLRTLLNGINPTSLTRAGQVILTGTVIEYGKPETFSETTLSLRRCQRITLDANGALVEESTVDGNTVTIKTRQATNLVGEAWALDYRPLLPISLLQEALSDPRIGLEVLNAANFTGIRFFLHTHYWTPGMYKVGTLAVDLTYEPSNNQITSISMLSRYDNNPYHTIPRVFKYADYRMESGWMVPHEITETRAGSVANTFKVQQASILPAPISSAQ